MMMENPSNSSKKPMPFVVGNSFVKQYYHLLAKSPETLHRFYTDDSKYTHGTGSHEEFSISGQKNINDKIMSLGSHGARVDLECGSVDCQASLNGGVVVMVTGTISFKNQKPRLFVQTFFLAVQPTGYFVLNDVFRYLEVAPPVIKKESSDVGTTPLSPMSKPVQSAPPAPVPTALVVSEKAPNSPKVDTPSKKKQTYVDKTTDAPAPSNKGIKATSPKKESSFKSPKAEKTSIHEEPSKPKSWASILASNQSNPVVAQLQPKSVAPVPRAVGSDVSVAPEGTKEKEKPSRYYSLFCREVPPEAKENDIRELFKEFGSIANVNILQSRGYAFVDYLDMDSVKKALAAGNEFTLLNKSIHVEEREKKQDGNQRNKGPNPRGNGSQKSTSRPRNDRNDRRDPKTRQNDPRDSKGGSKLRSEGGVN